MGSDNMAPAGWYQDHTDPTLLRYWDGSQWTEHTAPTVATRGPDAGTPQRRTQNDGGASDVKSQQGAVSHEDEPEASAELVSSTADRAAPEPPTRARRGVFSSKKALENEVEELRKLVDGFGYAEREALRAEITELRTQRDELANEVTARRGDLDAVQTTLVEAREEAMLQEVGVYDYHHPLEDSIAYRERLDLIRQRIRAMSKRDGGGVLASTDWHVNGSVAQGRKLVNDTSKLLLRAYNGEADVLVNKMRPYKVEAAIDRLNKTRSTIERLGTTLNIRISPELHRLRIEELELTADFLAKKAEEKEAERAEKERLREEARARREFEAEKARLIKEQAHYASALDRLRLTGTEEEIAAAEATLAEIRDAIHGVEEREANIRAGYVYVISNVGAFGLGVVKIGMTRRLDPTERIRELGDASVPFRYDTHALVFSEDAVSLENHLHRALAERRINRVNLRREFFYATPAEVRELLTEADGSVLEFVEEPEAVEWHQSENERRHTGVPAQSARAVSNHQPARADGA